MVYHQPYPRVSLGHLTYPGYGRYLCRVANSTAFLVTKPHPTQIFSSSFFFDEFVLISETTSFRNFPSSSFQVNRVPLNMIISSRLPFVTFLILSYGRSHFLYSFKFFLLTSLFFLIIFRLRIFFLCVVWKWRGLCR